MLENDTYTRFSYFIGVSAGVIDENWNRCKRTNESVYSPAESSKMVPNSTRNCAAQRSYRQVSSGETEVGQGLSRKS